MIAFAAIAVGAVLGAASGGSLSALRDVRFRFETLIVALFVAQGVARGRLFGRVLPGAMVIWLLTSIALVALLVANRRVDGFLVCAVGILLNLEVVLLNRGMPVTPGTTSVAQVGKAVAATGGLYRVVDTSTILPWAGDVIPLKAIGQLALLSVGDVMLLVGVVAAVTSIMTTSDAQSD